MVTIIFVNTFQELNDFREKDEINSILKSCAHLFKVKQEDFFLMTTKGKICPPNTLVKNNIDGNDKFLLLFQKTFLNTELFAYKKNWKEFSDYPVSKIERFDFSEFGVEDNEAQNNEFEVIRMNEEILNEADELARCYYAKFFTNNKIIKKNYIYLKYRKLIARGLLLMIENYLIDLQKDFKFLSEDVGALKHQVIQLNRNKSQGSQNTSPQMIAVISKYTKLIEKLENSLSNFKKKLLSNLVDDIETQNHSLLNLHNILKNLSSRIKNHNSNSEKAEIAIQMNLRVCGKLEKFNYQLRLLTDEHYHPKTPIVEKLKNQEKVFKLHEEINGSSSFIKDSSDLIDYITSHFERVNNIYKKITEFVSSFTHCFNIKGKAKLELLKKKYFAIKEGLDNLGKLDQSQNIERQIKSFSERSNVYNEFNIMSKIIEGLKKEKAAQNEFIAKQGKYLPINCYQALFNSFILNELADSSMKNYQEGKIADPMLSIAEINEFYKYQINKFEEQINTDLNEKNQNIKTIEDKIKDMNEEIEEIEKQRRKHQDTLENTFEEIGILGKNNQESDKIGNHALLKLEFLKLKQKIYIKKKMLVIQALRKLSKERQNPFITPS